MDWRGTDEAEGAVGEMAGGRGMRQRVDGSEEEEGRGIEVDWWFVKGV